MQYMCNAGLVIYMHKIAAQLAIRYQLPYPSYLYILLAKEFYDIHLFA